MNFYIQLLTDHEEWLMYRILEYAQKHEFSKYTSTLPEPWRMSINGLSNSLINAAKQFPNKIPELHPDDTYIDDPVSEFGLIEARKHRQRGTKLGMFLGLMKYYEECYIDLIEESKIDSPKRQFYTTFTKRCFNRIEIAYCIEWANNSNENLLKELQDANREMTNEKNKYLTIFDSSFVPTIYLDKELKISNINHAAIELFTDFKIAGSIYYNDYSSNPSLKRLNEKIIQFTRGKLNNAIFEISLETNKGNLYFQVKLKIMQDVSNKFSGTVVMLDDITEQKKAEEALKASEEDLQILNKNKDRFLQILAHDLKSPFNTLLGFSNLLLTNVHTYSIEKIEQQLKIINQTAYKTYNLLDDLLLWGNSQSKKIKFEALQINFNKICSEVISNMENYARKKEISIKFIEPQKTILLGDANMLKTVLRNLISNAIKFTNKNGQILIYTEENKNSITTIVSDSGIGIENDVIPKLWDFSQPISTCGTEDEKGTGFGLLICKEFIENHGGCIWVESEVGTGTDFKFTLPLSKN